MKKIGYNYLILIGAMAVFGSDTRAALPVTDGLVIHLEADSITGASNGSRIATWTGLVGSGMDAVQPTADSQPVYVASNPLFKGHATVQFDGTNDWMDLPSGSNCPFHVGSFTLIAVARFNAVNRAQYLVAGQAGSANDRLRIIVDWLNSYWAFHWRIGSTGWPGAINASPDTQVHIFGAGSGDGIAEGFLDGVSVGTASNSSTLQPGDFNIGCFKGASSFMSGDIAEVIVFNRKLTAEEYAQINEYLTLKYILTVSEPEPADGATNVGVIHGNNVDVSLQWKAAADLNNPTQTDPRVKKHYVYMDTDNTDADPNLYYIGEVMITDWSSLAASYGPVPLSYDQSVSWQIEEGLDNGLLGVYAPGDPNNWRGPIWSFKTLASVPVIDLQPQNQYFEAGAGEVLLTLTATTGFPPLTYQWYQEGVALSDGAKYQGTQTNTLVILNPDSYDEGGYSCQVTAENGSVTMSNTAIVKMKRLAARYPFELNANDAIGTNHGTAVGGLFYTSDVLVKLDGQTWAAEPNGVSYVQLPAGAYPKAGFGNGLETGSIAFWFKGNLYTRQTVIGSANDGLTTLIQVQAPYTGDGVIRLYMRSENGSAIDCQTAGTTLLDNKWHYVAVTYEVSSGTASKAAIYFDGKLAAEKTGSVFGKMADWTYPVTIFGLNNRGTITERCIGMFDDLQIYNYELTAEQIADTYYNVTGKQSCILEYASQFDLTGPDGQPDCKVDLYDLTAMSAVWLDSGLYPILP